MELVSYFPPLRRESPLTPLLEGGLGGIGKLISIVVTKDERKRTNNKENIIYDS